MKPNVAFLGLGSMGGGMAARLVAAGFPVTGWNRSAARAEVLRTQGATIAASPGAAAAGADLVISMVAEDEASRAVWVGEGGALSMARAGALLVECSTLSPDWVMQLAERASARGCAFLDAPVTGSRPQAANGELRFLAGGDAAALERARPVFAAMGRDVLHLGPVGSGARMKLVNNFLCGVQAAALAEALAMIDACKLDREAAMAMLLAGAPASPLVKTVSARMLARDYQAQFRLVLMRKDLAYAASEAGRHGVGLEMADAAGRLFDTAIAAGLGDKDFAAVLETIVPPAGETRDVSR